MGRADVGVGLVGTLLGGASEFRGALGPGWLGVHAQLLDLLRRLSHDPADPAARAALAGLFTSLQAGPAADVVRRLLAGEAPKARKKRPRTSRPHPERPPRMGGALGARPKALDRHPLSLGRPPRPRLDRDGAVGSGARSEAPLDLPTWSSPAPDASVPPPRRYLNTLFTEADGQTTLAPERALAPGGAYALYVDVSPEARGLGEPAVFPDRVLDACWRGRATLPLTVVASSPDLAIEPRLHTLELPRSGATAAVLFAVVAGAQVGTALIQVDVLHRGHLLQSKQVEVWVGDTPPAEAPAQTARLTFTACDGFDPEILDQLPMRVMTVSTERDPRDQSIGFRFVEATAGDREATVVESRWQPAELGPVVEAVRARLREAIGGVGPGGFGRVMPGFGGRVDGDDALLGAWLPALADVGHQLYRKVRGQAPRGPAAQTLLGSLEPGAVIQVNPVLGQVTLPWGLVYEKPVKYRYEAPEKSRVCRRFLEDGPACPRCEASLDPYVVCPSGFWGFRYAIEQVPGWIDPAARHPRVLLRRVENARPLSVNVAVFKDFQRWSGHLDALRGAGDLQVHLAQSIDELEAVWATHPELDLVYFYSHGGVDTHVGPYLRLSDGVVHSNFLEACALEWPHGPLVFLNGCGTGSYGPESWASLLNDFLAAGASGVVGTECPVTEVFAEAFARALLPAFFAGRPLGALMLEARLRFLREHKTPLGLAYSLFAAHEIALATAVV